MAINIDIPGQDTFNQGIADPQKIFAEGLMNFIKMHEARNAPQQYKAQADLMMQQALGKQLENQYASQTVPADIAYKQAMTNNLANKLTQAPQMKGVAAEFEGVQTIRKRFGDKSPEYQLALAAFLNKHKVGAQGQWGIPTNDFATGITNTQGPLAPGVNAAAPMVNQDPETGALIGPLGSKVGNVGAALINGALITKPTTPTLTKNQAQARANIGRELTAEQVKQPYVGLGSSAEMSEDYLRYRSTQSQEEKQALGKKLIDAAVAQRLVPEMAAYQLASQGVPATVDALKHQRDAITQGWGEGVALISKNLPPELQTKVREEHDRRLKDISAGVQSFTARGTPIPGSILQTRGEKSLETEPKKSTGRLYDYSDDDIAYTASRYKMTPEQVIELLRKKRG